MRDSDIGKAARFLAAHLREHFHIEGEPPPRSGGPDDSQIARLLALWLCLQQATPERRSIIDGPLDAASAVNRIRWSMEVIGVTYGFDGRHKNGVVISGETILDGSVVRALEWAADKLDPPEVGKPAQNGRKKRKRGTKKDTQLKTHAAITHKAQHPDATEQQVADAVGMARSTLQSQREWQEWVPKIERAAVTGKLSELQATVDKRLGEIVAYEPDGE
ncbi:MAG: hypothetical protein JXB62_14640 [Pirellulales bacterium]|nr:hypothetical protein [Pirellulales bacterium]